MCLFAGTTSAKATDSTSGRSINISDTICFAYQVRITGIQKGYRIGVTLPVQYCSNGTIHTVSNLYFSHVCDIFIVLSGKTAVLNKLSLL